jgi:hypothetical protein
MVLDEMFLPSFLSFPSGWIHVHGANFVQGCSNLGCFADLKKIGGFSNEFCFFFFFFFFLYLYCVCKNIFGVAITILCILCNKYEGQNLTSNLSGHLDLIHVQNSMEAGQLVTRMDILSRLPKLGSR